MTKEWTEIKSRKRNKVINSSDEEFSESEINFKKSKQEGATSRHQQNSKSQGETHLTEIKAAKPIFAAVNYVDVKNMCNNLKLKSRPTFKISGNSKTQIISELLSDKEIIIEALKTNQIGYHTFSEPSQKSKSFVLKGFYKEDCNVVLENIKSAGIEASKVTKPFKSDTLYLVQFDSAAKINVNQLNHNHRVIDYMAVKWEVLKNRSIPLQCHKCQRWGHSATNCGFKYRCMKCVEPHSVGECKRVPKFDDKPNCINCKGAHAANYRQCPEYIAYCKKKEAPKSAKVPKFSVANRITQQQLKDDVQFPKLISESPAVGPVQLIQPQTSTFANKVRQRENVSLTQNYYPQTQATRLSALQESLMNIPNIDESLEMFEKLITNLKKYPDSKRRCKFLLEFFGDICLTENGS